jgi:hypothetical protein
MADEPPRPAGAAAPFTIDVPYLDRIEQAETLLKPQRIEVLRLIWLDVHVDGMPDGMLTI